MMYLNIKDIHLNCPPINPYTRKLMKVHFAFTTPHPRNVVIVYVCIFTGLNRHNMTSNVVA